MKKTSFLAGLALAMLAVPIFAFDTRPAPTSADGVRAIVDLPGALHMKNVGGSDGAGLCVFTSLQHAAFWQNLKNLDGFRKFMESQPGGGYPQKVDDMLAKFCKLKGVPVPTYIQHEGGEEEFLDLAIKTGRTVCITYAGVDGFYNSPVGHMVNLAHIDATRFAIIDNNRPGDWVWMTRAQGIARWKGLNDDGTPMMTRDRLGRQFPIGGGWGVVFLESPPPPYPTKPVTDQSQFSIEQCGPGGCSRYPSFTPTLAPIPTEAHADGWEEVEADAGGKRWNHYGGGKLTGMLDSAGWHPIHPNGGIVIKAEALPVELKRPDIDNHLTGVTPNKLGKARKYSTNDGLEVGKRWAFEALQTLADDSSRWHLTAVGDSALIAKVRTDLMALPSDLQAKVLFQGYAPTDSPSFSWPIATVGLPSGVCLRAPSPSRIGADIACVIAADYTADKVVWLLQQPGGPLPPPPPPKPMPPPDPVKPDPAPAPSDPVKVDPAPAPPTILAGLPGWVLPAGLIALVLFLRKKTPTPA